MRITIEVCCDTLPGERRGDRLEAGIALLRRAAREAEENAGALCDPSGVHRYEVYGGTPADVVGFVRVEG